MVTLVNSFEGQTEGATVSTAETPAAGDNAFTNVVIAGTATLTFNGAAALHGSMGCTVATTASTTTATTFGWNPLSGTPTMGAARVYVKFPGSLPTAGGISLLQLRNAGQGKLATVQLSSTGFLQVVDSSGLVIWTAAAAITANTVYRLEIAMTTGASSTTGSINFDYYVGDSTTTAGTGFSTTTANTGSNGATFCIAGMSPASGSPIASGATAYFDDFKFVSGSMSYVGPFGSAVPGPPTGVSASLAGGVMSVAFTVPGSNGGSAISGYTVTATSSDGGATAVQTGTASPILFNPGLLSSGNTYTFAVTATNATGVGASSSASASIKAPQLAVPTSDVTTAGWTPSSGSTDYAMLASTLDTNFTTSGANPSAQVLEVGMGTLSVPADANNWAIAVRLRGNNFTTSATAVISLYQGSTLIQASAPQTLTNSATDYVMQITSGNAATINTSALNTLHIRVSATAS